MRKFYDAQATSNGYSVNDDIPTAEGFYLNPNSYITRQMIDFAKLHLKAQTKAILLKSEKWRDLSNGHYEKVSKDSIVNAYSLNNIK